MNKINSPEALNITKLKKGKSFYTIKQDKAITAISNYYKIKVKTERCIVINPQNLKITRITKVTIL